jgi:hypothetical protein
LSTIGGKKSIGFDGIPGEILKLSWKVMIPYLDRWVDITMNTNVIPGDLKSYSGSHLQGRERSVIENYRPVNLTSVVCKNLEQVIAGYLRQVWDLRGWLHGS